MTSDEHNDRPEGQGNTGLPVPSVWLTLNMMNLSERNTMLQNLFDPSPRNHSSSHSSSWPGSWCRCLDTDSPQSSCVWSWPLSWWHLTLWHHVTSSHTHIPGTGRLASGGVQFTRPAQHWLRLSKPPVGDRGSGVGDSREAETSSVGGQVFLAPTRAQGVKMSCVRASVWYYAQEHREGLKKGPKRDPKKGHIERA